MHVMYFLRSLLNEFEGILSDHIVHIEFILRRKFDEYTIHINLIKGTISPEGRTAHVLQTLSIATQLGFLYHTLIYSIRVFP